MHAHINFLDRRIWKYNIFQLQPVTKSRIRLFISVANCEIKRRNFANCNCSTHPVVCKIANDGKSKKWIKRTKYREYIEWKISRQQQQQQQRIEYVQVHCNVRTNIYFLVYITVFYHMPWWCFVFYGWLCIIDFRIGKNTNSIRLYRVCILEPQNYKQKGRMQKPTKKR